MSDREKKAYEMADKEISITLSLQEWVHLGALAYGAASKMINPEEGDLIKRLEKDMTSKDFREMFLTAYVAVDKIREKIDSHMIEMFRQVTDVDA